MTIKTITCHHVYNHGAYLQAWALIEYLRKIGQDASIINYCPSYKKSRGLWCINNSNFDKPIIRLLYMLAKLPSKLSSLKRRKVFNEFFDKYMPIDIVLYHSFEELKANPPKADIYIAGSDQIWNTMFKQGTDPAYYLGFGSCHIKRISYAASFATDEIKPGCEEFVKKHLQRFDAISIRESSAKRILKNLGYNGTLVVDPVFLLNKDEWDKLTSQDVFGRNYVLVYDFLGSDQIKTIAKRIAKLRSLKIYSIGSRRLRYAHRNFIYVDPRAFVTLIKNSTCVVSNSFHGTAFSMIFEKDFFVINRDDGLNSRMRDLLKRYGISNRQISASVDDKELLCSINYNNVRVQLRNDIKTSKLFLEKNLTY